ncbi:MAG: hypothetical protein ABI763_07315 [Bacteroidota bacterium]
MLLHESPQLAIYDECYVCAQALHNSFKRLGFILHEVSQNEDELIRFIHLKPAALLFHLDSSKENAYSLLSRLKQRDRKLKILVQTILLEKEHAEILLKSGADSIITGRYNFKNLIEKLTALHSSFEIYAEGIIDLGLKTILNDDDPFFKIASDPKKLRLTRLLMGGHSTKVIAQMIDVPETDIEMLRKKILHDTKCQNVAEYIGKAKDRSII